jgi:glycosidase
MASVSRNGVLARGFRLSRAARDLYRFPDTFLTPQGNVLFPTFSAARLFAERMNAQRQPTTSTRAAHAGQVNALGLIEEIMRYVMLRYQQQQQTQALTQALALLDEQLGPQTVTATLTRFVEDFPPAAVYAGEMSATDYLAWETGGVSHRQLLLEELLLLWVDNMNPACAPYGDLFDDAALSASTSYPALIEALRAVYAALPPFGPDGQSLPEMLRAPALAVPHSLTGQLEYILAHWGSLLDDYLFRLLRSLDLIKEEEKSIFAGPGPAEVYDYASLLEEPERFSEDRDWMPRLVLLAKNAYVWLDQLSKTYQRDIYRLDQIPDEELDTLARRGFTGLWLIGLWERSVASRRIKQQCGNPEAVASAYSLLEYEVAQDLGGPAALASLKARAWQRGIRLASDMVPNHMGIDSKWVLEHPDWFVSLDENPFPAYTFNGDDLSSDARVGLYIEDHYYTRNDAAVVFKRVDRETDTEQYIYHGNDGTNMPWNDTAQLNYLLPRVREAVIQTILHVAREFPVIRFDAAMTLAKKHYQRLWFPEPGSGGAIPTRAEHGLSRRQFDQAFPVEFWREVVDRVAREAPDTLLLAEAFWLMEGYFVRTLGMHRVYNSAFMNMLRDEENANYRSVMKNTMEFDPEIMQRFVNFMNNPDERTAVDQFGTGDKYFGVCVLMCTLPGLPMFGHGQIEGFTEKYGMEYRRAYRDEQVDQGLVARHEREICPILHRRHIFAGAEHFLLYDFYTPEGQVNEDVFAYSNRADFERGLIIYHNKFATARGWIRTSAAVLDKAEGARALRQYHLGEGLALSPGDGCYVIFRDYRTGLEYIRENKELYAQGLYVELHAYQCHIFLDFREVRDDVWGHYGQVCASLNGQGTPSVDDAVRELYLRPLHAAFHALINPPLFARLLAARVTEPGMTVSPALEDEIAAKCLALLQAAEQFSAGADNEVKVAQEMRQAFTAALELPARRQRLPLLFAEEDAAMSDLADDPARWGVAFGWAAIHALGRITGEQDAAAQSREWVDDWLLGKMLALALVEMGATEDDARQAVRLLRLLISEDHWYRVAEEEQAPARALLARLLRDDDARRLLHIHRYQQIDWFNREGFHTLLDWLQRIALITSEDTAALQTAQAMLTALLQAEKQSDYQVEKLLAALEPTAMDEK